MSYTKTTWVNNQAPAINADNLNHMEQGIESAHNQIDINTSDIDSLETQTQTNTQNIATETSTRQSQDSLLQSQIDQLVAPTGEAPTPAEIENARIGDDGVTYDTLGNAIRGQFSNVKSDLNRIISVDGTEYIADKYISSVTGAINTWTGAQNVYGYVHMPVHPDMTITYKADRNEEGAVGYAFYNEQGVFISGGVGTLAEQVLTVPKSAHSGNFTTTKLSNVKAFENAYDIGEEILDIDNSLHSFQDLGRITTGGFYATNTGVGNAMSSTFTTNDTWQQGIYPAVEGDKFRINGIGGVSGRAWAFLDSNNIILKVSQADLVCNNLVVIAPPNTAKVAISLNVLYAGNPYSVEQWKKIDISKIEELEPKVERLESESQATIILPSKIYCVLNRPFNITFKNITQCDNFDNYYFGASRESSEFINLGTSERIIASTASTRSLLLTLYRNNTKIAEKNTNIISLANNQPQIKAMFIGDSFTDVAIYIAELKHLMGNNLILYGTRTTDADDSEENNHHILHEGRAGWALKNFVSNASYISVNNAFYNPTTNTFDFSYYMGQNSEFSDVTDVFILSGPNDWTLFNSKATYLNYLKVITDSIKDYNSSIRIHIMTPLHCIDNGYSFGIHAMTYRQRYNLAMDEYTSGIISNYDGANGFSVIPTNINFDTWYDFDKTTAPVNFRNPATMEVGSDFVHPSKYGYYRMADMIFADIIGTAH